MNHPIWLMKRCVQIFLVISFASTAWGDYATLLIAFDPVKDQTTIGQKRFARYTEKLSMYFKKSFSQSGLEPRVVEKADQFDLYHALNDPQNRAVFWMSHAASSKSKKQEIAISSPGMILDSQLFDVTPVFNSINPSLKYLSVISCRSKTVLNRRYIDFPKNLVVRSFERNVIAKRALKYSVAEAKKLLIDGKLLDIEKVDDGVERLESAGAEVTIRRTAVENSVAPAVRIESGGRILTVLPPLLTGQSQEVNLRIPNDLKKMVFNLGDRIQRKNHIPTHLGKIEVTSTHNGAAWLPFTGVHGQELGETQRLFRKQMSQ